MCRCQKGGNAIKKKKKKKKKKASNRLLAPGTKTRLNNRRVESSGVKAHRLKNRIRDEKQGSPKTRNQNSGKEKKSPFPPAEGAKTALHKNAGYGMSLAGEKKRKRKGKGGKWHSVKTEVDNGEITDRREGKNYKNWKTKKLG